MDENSKFAITHQINEGEKFFKAIRNGKAFASQRYMGAYTKFWRDWMNMTETSAKTVRSLKIPSIVLQGNEDANVIRADFEALSKATASHPLSQSHWLNNLNHLFTKGEKTTASPAALAAINNWLDKVILAQKTNKSTRKISN